MSLSDEQYEFARDATLLLINIVLSEKITKFTVGHVFRSPEEQQALFDEGLSQRQYGQHNKKLAIDLNFWIRGQYAMGWDEHKLREELRELGTYWESLSPLNKWGGFWEFFDPGHFERQDA